MTTLSKLAGLTAICLIGFTGSAPARQLADEGTVARLNQALAHKEAEDGKSSPYLLPVIEQLAEAHLLNGRFGETRTLRRRALDIALAAFGCESAIAAEAMVSLAMLDIDSRRYLDAEPLLIVARRVLHERVDAEHPAMARIFSGLSRVALARGDTRPAEHWARRALAIARANPHGRSAEPLRALGAALTAEQHFDEAERVLTEALAQDRKQHGADGLDTARSLSQLASSYLRAGRAGDALPLIEEAAAIDQASLGPVHPFIADDLHDLGLVYDALHRAEDARRAFGAAVKVLEQGAGRDTPRMAYAELELSRLYRQQGDAAAAEAAFREARRILNKAEAEERRRERNV